MTDKKVEMLIDRALRASEGLAPSIKSIIERSRNVAGTAAAKVANEIVIDATLLHDDILSLAAEFRFKQIPRKAAFLETEALQRRVDLLRQNASKWSENQ